MHPYRELSINELQKLSFQGDRDAQYFLGLNYEDDGKIAEACKWFLKSADQDHMDSQFKIGFYYRWGDTGFPADANRGEYWLKRAAEKGHDKAQFHLGNYYRSIGNLGSAATWFKKAAEQGEKRSMFRYALLNETRAFPGANINDAITYYTKLAQETSVSRIDENNTDAMLYLGILYCEGDYMPPDPVKGKEFLEKALRYWEIARGKIEIQPYDCYRVGILYCTGQTNHNKTPGVSDLEKGIKFLNIAIHDGLEGFHPGNITLATQIRNDATEQLRYLNRR